MTFGDLLGLLVIIPIGGLIISLVLRADNAIKSWKSVILITLGWTIGSLISLAIFMSTYDPVLLLIFGGAIFGAVGGGVLVFVLRTEGRNARQPTEKE
jgi:membrane associated rhomboid family serine protease